MSESLPSSLSVVIMAFNEVEGLPDVVREIDGTLSQLGCPAEILIIDDGSSDGTGEAADDLGGAFKSVRVVHHGENRGLGGVYRTGLRESRLDCVTFFPADGQFPAEIIERFWPSMQDHDLVLGYLPGGRSGLFGAALSAAERLLYRLLFGPLPRFQGILMVRRTVLDRIPLTSAGRGWAVVMELIIRAVRAGCRIRSLPTSLRPRTTGVSKVQNARTIWSNLRQVLALRRHL
ncbi:MAG TPA: glycosyltransferase [Vicinamibacteria bacterium]|nr:glycosyltransferase [Vicinamibacteria bacterium]